MSASFVSGNIECSKTKGEKDMVKSRFLSLGMLCMLILAVIVGCSQGDTPANNSDQSPNPPKNEQTKDAAPEANPEEYTGGPVELLVQDHNTGITEEEFEEYFAKPVKERYPDITLTLTKERNLEVLVTAGTTPDLAAISNTVLDVYLDADYPANLNEMIKQLNIDLGKFEPSIIEVLEGLGQGEGIYGLPFGMNYGAIIYNKDIFDLFGVDYPDDVITWDDFYDLNVLLTRVDGSTQYVGGAPNVPVNMLRQMGVSNFDESGDTAVFTTDGHLALFTMMKRLYEIPGYIQGETYRPTSLASGTVAMLPGWIASMTNTVSQDVPFDWDVVAYPVFKERPNIGAPVDFHMLTVSKATEHKEAAYRVILTMTSEEVQERISKNRRITPLVDPEIKMTYAQDSQVYDGKNLQSIFKVEPAVLPDYSRWASTIRTAINDVAKEIALNNVDINTALREAEQKANQAIQEEMK